MSSEPKPAVEEKQLWLSPYSQAGSLLRLVYYGGGAVSVQFRRRTLLVENGSLVHGELISWQVGFFAPIGLNEIGRALEQLCTVYDGELTQHVVELLAELAKLPEASTPTGPQGAMMN